jgi:hypothetical protein
MRLQLLSGPLNLRLGLLGCPRSLLFEEFFELILHLVQITFEFYFLLRNECLEFLPLLRQRVLNELLDFLGRGGRLGEWCCVLGQFFHA